MVQRNGGSGHIAGHAAGDGGLWSARGSGDGGSPGCFLGKKMGDEPAEHHLNF